MSHAKQAGWGVCEAELGGGGRVKKQHAHGAGQEGQEADEMNRG